MLKRLQSASSHQGRRSRLSTTKTGLVLPSTLSPFKGSLSLLQPSSVRLLSSEPQRSGLKIKDAEGLMSKPKSGKNKMKRGKSIYGPDKTHDYDIPFNPSAGPHGTISGENQDVTHELITQSTSYKLERSLRDSTRDLVPWFLKNMPAAYFRNTTDNERIVHLQAITALHGSGAPPNITITREEEREIIKIRPGTLNQSLGSLLQTIPNTMAGHQLGRVHIFTALDRSLSIDIFRYGTDTDPEYYTNLQESKDSMFDYAKEIANGVYKGDPLHVQVGETELGKQPFSFDLDDFQNYVTNSCTPSFIQMSSSRRFFRMYQMYKQVQSSEDVAVHIERDWRPAARGAAHTAAANQNARSRNLDMITFAGTNVIGKLALLRTTEFLYHQWGFETVRAHLDTLTDPTNQAYSLEPKDGTVSMIRMVVTPMDERASKMTEADYTELANQIRQLKWLDPEVFSLADIKFGNQGEDVGLRRAEALVTFANLLHGKLAKVYGKFRFARPRIFDIVDDPQNLPVFIEIADLFLRRFDPKNKDTEEDSSNTSSTNMEDMKLALKAKLPITADEEASILVDAMVDTIEAIKKTNFFVPGRYAHCVRLDGEFLGVNEEIGEETPYGTFFMHGRNFNAFQVRFRDIARGGLRVVAPSSREMYEKESERHYAEVYSLAFAQQLKNKDIPEGGSKAVLLMKPPKRNSREFAGEQTRKSVMAFADSLLDLTVRETEDGTPSDKSAEIVDFLGHEEQIFLGPDENIIPRDIDWIVRRAEQRGHPNPNSFMSSKPDAGINHKEYGVTSEGVNVFLDVALRKVLNIDPTKESFTVKLTGGPDGDVAGNEIKILQREYGSNAKIVGVADGSGVAEDPNGLDIEELMRLFTLALPIADFDASKLSSDENAVVMDANSSEGITRRNTMVNRVEADVFVPAGGRPKTIHEDNYQDFCTIDEATGKLKPSSSLVVEGANLFINPQARQLLFDEAGVRIVKDSSANKCGVICSSMEILSSFLVTPEKFIERKEEIVNDVLKHLRKVARVEAELLFRESANYPEISLPVLSQRISDCIIKTHDAVYDALVDTDGTNFQGLDRMGVVEDYIPQALLEESGMDISELEKSIPKAYLNSIVAATLASSLVYSEGLSYVEGLSNEQLATVAVKFVQERHNINDLISRIEAMDLGDDGEKMKAILSKAGIRVAVENGMN